MCLRPLRPPRSSKAAVQVLHIDRNNYYGGQSASLNLNQVGAAQGGAPGRQLRVATRRRVVQAAAATPDPSSPCPLPRRTPPVEAAGAGAAAHRRRVQAATHGAPLPCPVACSSSSASGPARSRLRSWGPAGITTWIWFLNSSW